jgi:hypothetical protein
MLSFPFWSRRSLPGKSDKITVGTLGEAADRDECEVLIEEETQSHRKPLNYASMARAVGNIPVEADIVLATALSVLAPLRARRRASSQEEVRAESSS